MKRVFFIFLLLFALNGFCEEKRVLIAEVKEAITPVTDKFIERVIRLAEVEKYDVVIFLLDTPGGLFESTRNIVQRLLSTKVDTVVYVYPEGARAASAGVFITLAAKYAAMAKACNIGAAHPVTIQQGEKESENTKTLMKKMENDAVAFVESIAKVRKRNVRWAIKAVRESVSITSEKALEEKVIDFVASNEDELLVKIYGKNTKFFKKVIEKNWAEKLLAILANPNIAYFLLILGFYGILYEIIHPGTIFSGVLGALCLILGLFSLQILPVNFAGLMLIILAFVLFLLEVYVASYGLLTIGGIISLVLGSAMLFNSPDSFFRVSASTIITVLFTTLGFLGILIFAVSKTLKKKPSSGKEGMEGEEGIAIDNFISGEGYIKVHGEIWRASSVDEIKKGEKVKVLKVDGLTLEVIKVKK
jgi:membrane-bound serine protease (ClpP class)